MDDCVVFCPAAEELNYRRAVGASTPIIGYDRAITSLAELRNYVLDSFEAEQVVMLDDDIKHCCCLVGLTRSILNASQSRRVIDTVALAASECGAKLFGFNQAWDVRKVRMCEPVRLRGWIGGVVGVVGRLPRWDESLRAKVDIDACLRELHLRRILWVDDRYSFEQKRDNNSGGSFNWKTQQVVEDDLRRLRRKWGNYFVVNRDGFKSQIKCGIAVPRKQSISLTSPLPPDAILDELAEVGDLQTIETPAHQTPLEPSVATLETPQ